MIESGSTRKNICILTKYDARIGDNIGRHIPDSSDISIQSNPMNHKIQKIIGKGYQSHQSSRPDQINDNFLTQHMLFDIPRTAFHKSLFGRIPSQGSQGSHLRHQVNHQNLSRVDRNRNRPNRLRKQTRQDSKKFSSIGSNTRDDCFLEILKNNSSLLDRIY